MGEWIVTNHPAAVIQDRTKNLRPWLRDCWKIRRILRGVPVDERAQIIYVETKEEFDRAVEGWTDFAFDLETDTDNNLFVHCMAVSNGERAVVLDTVLGADLSWVRELFLREGLRIVQNGAFDMPILRSHGIDYDWSQTFDIMLASAVLSPDEPNSLAYITAMYQDYWAWKYRSGENMAEYNAEDAFLTYRNAIPMITELKEKDQWEYFTKTVMPTLIEVIIPLNEAGVYIDEPLRQQLLQKHHREQQAWQNRLDDHLQRLGKTLNKEIPYPLGPSGGTSYPKMTALLYKTLHLPPQVDPESRRLSTSKEALKKLKPKDKTETVSLLLEGSKLGEMTATLMGSHPRADGKVYSRFILGGDEKHESLQGAKALRNAPRTGRLSSREPNYQNTHWTARYIIRAASGLHLVERDYSQIELRLNARFSGDPGLAKALQAGDAHLYIAWLCDQVHGRYKIANYSWDECYARFLDHDPNIIKARKAQKTPTYGWFYRMGPTKLWLVYDIPTTQGRILLEGLNQAFPGVVQWWEQHVGEVAQRHYYRNPFGRRRYFLDWKEEVPAICNAPAQSTAADILFRAMLTIQRTLTPQIGRLLLTVHDQVLGEGPDPIALNSLFKAAMDQPFPELDNMVVPSDAKTGHRWGPKLHPDTGELYDELGMETLLDTA